MGGVGSGGARPGAGRKKKDVHLKLAHGTATAEERRRAAEAGPPVTSGVTRPADLEPEMLEVWERLAPKAIEQRTLISSTVEAFLLLCRAVLQEKKYRETLDLEGYTIDTAMGLKAHPLVGPQRAMMQRVEAGMVRFRLSPIGKELSVPGVSAKPTNKLKALRGGLA